MKNDMLWYVYHIYIYTSTEEITDLYIVPKCLVILATIKYMYIIIIMIILYSGKSSTYI
jgi:hypothetical protein